MFSHNFFFQFHFFSCFSDIDFTGSSNQSLYLHPDTTVNQSTYSGIMPPVLRNTLRLALKGDVSLASTSNQSKPSVPYPRRHMKNLRYYKYQ